MLNMDCPPPPNMKDQDTYGSVLREEMKRSMSEPFKAYNKREPRTVEAWVLGVAIVGIVALGVTAVYLFNYVEHFFR